MHIGIHHFSLHTLQTCSKQFFSEEFPVFLLHLDEVDADDFKQLYRVLSREEQKRANRFYALRDARLFVAVHGALRYILAHYLALPPDKLTFAQLPGGKPLLTSRFPCALHFNISHSRNLGAIAVARHHTVGVDVECTLPLSDFQKLADHCFHPEEARAIRARGPVGGLRRFYAIWTRKEAVVKALGEDFLRPFSSFMVSSESSEWQRIALTPQSDKPVYVSSFATKEHYQGALAFTAPNISFQHSPSKFSSF